MGKITGFMEYPRIAEQYEKADTRIKHYREFVLTLTNDAATQQGARCMDCGIPFCNNGCPVNNIIPDWNDLVYRGELQKALAILHSTNNFPEFTGRICPAPCESACTLGIHEDPVGIKSIERYIIDTAWEKGWVTPQIPVHKTGKKIAVVGSGPAGLASAQQLARAGHEVTVFEKNSRIGGLMRYGIPDFKLDKNLIVRRIAQMESEGVSFMPNTLISANATAKVDFSVSHDAKKTVSFDELDKQFDAIVLSGGAESPRDLPVPGRELEGVHFAMTFLSQQNKVNAGDKLTQAISAIGKHVVVIGGGDTGSDCVGTSNRQGASSVMQFEVMSMPPEQENKPLVWPYWPIKLRTSSSHEEGCERDFAVATKRFEGSNGKLTKLIACRVQWRDGKMIELPNSEFEVKADLVFLAMGFVAPIKELLTQAKNKIELDVRGNVKADTEEGGENLPYATSRKKFFAAGDIRRGQSLVVWAIREGRQCARAVDQFLMGHSDLPR